MAANKVVFGNKVLIDLTGDTVTEEALLKGYTAHKADGTIITGTAFAGYPNEFVFLDNIRVFIDFSIFAFGYEMLSAVVRSMIRVEFKLVPNAIEYFAIPIVCQLGILTAAIFICIIEKIFAPKLISLFV